MNKLAAVAVVCAVIALFLYHTTPNAHVSPKKLKREKCDLCLTTRIETGIFQQCSKRT